MRQERTPTNILVTRLDFTAHLAGLVDGWVESHPDQKPIDGASMMHEWGYVSLPDGGVYVICTEGVGYPLEAGDEADFDVTIKRCRTTTEPLPLPPGARYLGDPTKERVVTTHTYFAEEISLTPEQIKAWPTKDAVNLKDFIRRFGARLERNYSANCHAIESLIGGEG